MPDFLPKPTPTRNTQRQSPADTPPRMQPEVTSISLSTLTDVDAILNLYLLATEHQRAAQATVVWPKFERSLVEREVAEQRQFKLCINGTIACVWAITYSDPNIWAEREQGDAVYVHRIATNPIFRGRQLVHQVTNWTVATARTQGLRYVRLDTMGHNEKLIALYRRAGFTFLGMHDVPNPAALPKHYHEGQVALFEYALTAG